ncbi:MAG: UvrD-helicase domain-containing protein [Flavobacteriaceae bacterium]|nr:UvrD-helicase domain-containing protein [Flavobacteriaceae bacterium]
MDKRFLIFNASAGSGKTYQLTKTYLVKLLRPQGQQPYRELLAITFTNKAVAEMKERILDNLFAFGQDPLPAKNRSMFDEVKKELDLTDEALRAKAKYSLKSLLHNYGFFEVSTIDKFNHRIIRTFARDLGVAQNFEVELNVERLLQEAVNDLLIASGEDMDVTRLLLEFSLEKIQQGKSWNIAFDLEAMGKILFQENHQGPLALIQQKGLARFIALRKKLAERVKTLQQQMRNWAEEALALIDENGLEASDFNRGAFPKFMETIKNGNFQIDFKAVWKQEFDSQPLYAKSKPEPIKAKLDALHPRLTHIFNSIKQSHYTLAFLMNCQKNLVPLALLSEIGKMVEKIKIENGILPISEFNSLISKQIKGQPAPFIYERLGEKFRHYFIDEFQDTSKLQWNNLIPLIANALESEDERGEPGSLLLVGDVKQSIYRWRGGDPEQFLALNQSLENPFQLDPQITVLKTNWRSHDEIIDFNNNFFKGVAEQLESPSHRALFSQTTFQESNGRPGGYVELNFVGADPETTEDAHLARVADRIAHLLDLGHALHDICILIRENRRGPILANSLIEKGIPVITADSLLLKNSQEVLFLVGLLRLIQAPSEMEVRFDLLRFLAKAHHQVHDFIAATLPILPDHLKTVYGFDLAKVGSKEVLDILEEAILKFNLIQDSNAYINALLDEVALPNRTTDSLYGFLQYWDRNKDQLALPTLEGKAAVRIMSIHRAKGLEFPFTIFPYADTVIADRKKANKLWVPLASEQFEGFDEFLVNASTELPEVSESIAEIAKVEQWKSQLDDLNVLYVACTRAIKGLFVISTQPSPKNSGSMGYAQLFEGFVKTQGRYEPGTPSYRFGQLSRNKAPTHSTEAVTPIPYIYTLANQDRFNAWVATSEKVTATRQEALEHGSLLHRMLGDVYSVSDLEPVLNRFQVPNDRLGIIRNILTEVIVHPTLAPFFTEGLEVYNERELLLEDGNVLRPDKMVFFGKRATVIDYKTGEASPSHRNQIETYADILTKMGYFVEHKILVYLNETVNPLLV